MNTALAVIGFTLVAAAAIGGGLKAANIEVPVLATSRQQLRLAIIGLLALVAAVAAPWLNAQASSAHAVNAAPPSIPPSASSIPVNPSSAQSPRSSPTQSTGSQSQPPSPLPTHPACFDTVFSSIPPRRIFVVQGGDGYGQQVGPAYRGNPNDLGGQYGILLIDSTSGDQAAIQVNIDPVNQQFSIERDIDDTCQDMQASPASGSLGTTSNFYMGVLSETLSFQTETVSGRYWLEVNF